jgi:hypothetical protein
VAPSANSTGHIKVGQLIDFGSNEALSTQPAPVAQPQQSSFNWWGDFNSSSIPTAASQPANAEVLNAQRPLQQQQEQFTLRVPQLPARVPSTSSIGSSGVPPLPSRSSSANQPPAMISNSASTGVWTNLDFFSNSFNSMNVASTGPTALQQRTAIPITTTSQNSLLSSGSQISQNQKRPPPVPVMQSNSGKMPSVVMHSSNNQQVPQQRQSSNIASTAVDPFSDPRFVVEDPFADPSMKISAPPKNIK